MGIAKEMETRLSETFAPRQLEVHDESEQHIGHAGYQEGGESHWRIVIAAEALNDMSRIARHRAIHAALGKDIIDRIHALSSDVR
ncbi:BolA family protein [Marivivens aquimaris]|uniref:BolA family protein n=1 Tax=Marivivens aquimaris TaxID=2774876 RepID=UPI0018810609|nr:BolA family protein [Marivivens aquimaris]